MARVYNTKPQYRIFHSPNLKNYVVQEKRGKSGWVTIGRHDTKAEAIKELKGWKGRMSNPSADFEEVEELARGFHGRDNRETFTIKEVEEYRENLAFLGEMLDIEVFIEGRKKDGLITLPFEDVMLGASADRKQLYFVGDTSLPDDWLKKNCLGWDKDKVSIGWVYAVSYFADKHHLTGPKQQKKGMEYRHCFGEQTIKAPARFEGVWKLKEKWEMGLLPILIYNRLSQCMELVGGAYIVKDEGIWD